MVATFLLWWVLDRPMTVDTRWATPLQVDVLRRAPAGLREAVVDRAAARVLVYPLYEEVEFGPGEGEAWRFVGVLNIVRNRYHFTQLPYPADPFGRR